ncbi:MAG: hypothetical protein ACETV1_02890, partial [Candidatus Bathyarchaeia archaeon]
YVHSLLALQDLILLKLEMLYIFEPDRKLEHSLNHLFTVQSFGIFRKWLLDDCRDNPEGLKDESMKAIDDLANKHLEVLFPETENSQTTSARSAKLVRI